MRIWDIDPKRLCRNHLLGEHAELHATWAVLTKNRKGYSHHPEVLRWRGKLRGLYGRHEKLICEITCRGYAHKSPLPKKMATGSSTQNILITPYREQLRILRNKGCKCDVGRRANEQER
jgi:hypothetical protein